MKPEDKGFDHQFSRSLSRRW